MKKFLVFIIGTLLFVSCNTAPDIQKLTELTRPEVENLITEDNNDETYIRLDRYFLSEKPDDRTYIGSVKMTAFYKHTKWNFSTLMREEVVDSLKLYKEVIIKFTDNKYDYYTIHIE